ncbi:MAG: AAA family ATPase [Bacteroidota bacterium]
MDQFRISNFRVFEEFHAFEIAPITILTGKNNSGKSSLIRALMVLDDLLNGRDQTRLDFSTSSVKDFIPIFENAKNLSSRKNEIELGITIHPIQFDFILKSDANYNAILASLQISSLDSEDKIVLTRVGEEFDIEMKADLLSLFLTPSLPKLPIQNTLEEAELLLELNLIKEEKHALRDKTELIKLIDKENTIKSRLSNLKKLQDSDFIQSAFQTPIKKRVQIARSDAKISDIFLEYFNLVESNPGAGFKRKDFMDFVENNKLPLSKLDSLLSIQTIHIGINRIKQQRLFHRETNDSEISQIVNYLGEFPLKPKSKAKKFLIKWLGKDYYDIATNYEIRYYEKSAAALFLTHRGKAFNIADLGYGTGQLTSILLDLAALIHRYEDIPSSAEEKDTIIIMIEEPETNLHPRMQSLLADLFYDAVQISKEYFNLRLIVESHSEYLIRKLQLNIAKDEMSKDDAVIHYMDFNSDQDEKHRKIDFAKNGSLSDSFGPGFYDEAAKQSIELNRIIRSKK